MFGILCTNCKKIKHKHLFTPENEEYTLRTCKTCRDSVKASRMKKSHMVNVPEGMLQCKNCRKIKQEDHFKSKTGKRTLKTCRACIQSVQKYTKVPEQLHDPVIHDV